MLRQQKLFEGRYVTFYDPETRDAPETLDDFVAAPHAMALLGGSEYSDVDQQLGKQGLRRKKSLIVDQLQTLPSMMKGTELVSTLPVGFSPRLMKDFAYVESPIQMPSLPIYAVWHVVKDQDNGHKWLRGLIREVVG